jgi:hypothetical protein
MISDKQKSTPTQSNFLVKINERKQNIENFLTYAPKPLENGFTTLKQRELAMNASILFPPLLTMSPPISEHTFS